MTPGNEAIITIAFLDWWLGGTGETETGGADKNAYRDEWGCPALPASQVKGTLRETAELWANWTAEEVTLFFGSRPEDTDPRKSVEGHLEFAAEAALPQDMRLALCSAPAVRAQLFSSVPATAINPETGSAKDQSLREIEVAVPMQLTLGLRWRGREEPPAEWQTRIDQLCALTPAFGALKQDGFGRCIALCGLAPAAQPEAAQPEAAQ